MKPLESSLLLFLCYFVNSAWGQEGFNPVPRNQRRPQGSPAVMPRSFTANNVREAFQIAAENIAERNQAISGRRRGTAPTRDSAIGRHNFFQKSKPRARRLGTTQEKFEEATRVLITEYNLTPEQIKSSQTDTDLKSILRDNSVEDCEAMFDVQACTRSRFRSFDGTCNNLDHPTWGMAASCFQRLLDPVYADGVAEFRRAVSGRPLPNPRTISLDIHSHLDSPTEYVTHMFMQWGQFLDHDISLTPLSTGPNNEQLNCCPIEDDAPMNCAPIVIDADDPFYSAFNIDCLTNTRSTMCSTCKLGARQHTNQLTSFIDASQVYSNSLNDSRGLRTLDGSGSLRSRRNTNAGELLPESDQPAEDFCSFQREDVNCFQTGDPRGNQHPALTSFHTIFLRHHNNIVRRLQALNRNWDDERLFEEARRIVGAQMQVITYREYLPLVIGPERMQWFDLNVRQDGYTQYDATVEPTLVHEFSTASFRFGHSMINTMFPEISRTSNTNNRLRDIFLFPFGLYEGQLERIMRGLSESPGQKFDRWIVRDVTNHLYQNRGNQSGLDLASLNVLRGRDHGIPPYVDLVEFCGGPKIRTFRDLDRLFQRNARQIFQSVYEDVRDIDLFSGGLAERPNQGAVVGPTFTCVIGIQFYHLKYGDRFYFEHGGQSGSFTQQQLAELRRTSFAKIICDNSEIDEIPPNVFMYPDNRRNRARRCRELPEPNLSAWRQGRN